MKKLLTKIKCLLSLHEWHKYSPKPHDWWANHVQRKEWVRFCKHCYYNDRAPK